LLADLYACSTDADSADADYCFCFESYDINDKDKYSSVNFLFLKEKRKLKPIRLNVMQEHLNCEGYAKDTYSKLDFVDKLGGRLFSGFGAGSGYSIGRWVNTSTGELKPVTLYIESIIQPDFPKVIVEQLEEHRRREDLLLLKNRIVNAYVKESFECYKYKGTSLIDTTYRINFRVKIIGECDSLQNAKIP